MGLLPPIQAWTFKRSGSISTNPNLFAQKSTAFASAALSNYSTVTIIATRDEEGVHGYLVGRGRVQMDDAALQLAHSVGAKVERIEQPPQLRGPGSAVVGRLHYVHGESGGLIQAGADPADVIRTLAQSMPHGSWVGASLRRPTRYEKSRWFEYLKSRPSASASHHTRQTNFPVITSIYAATATRSATRALLNQVAGTLPGFDMNVATQVPNRFSAIPLPWLVPAALFGLTHAHKVATALDKPEIAARFAQLFDPGLVQPAIIAAAVASLLLLIGVLPSRWSRLMSAVRRGTLPRPYHRAFRAKRGKVADFQHRSQMGEYPLDNRSFMVAPHLLTTLVAPHAGALSGSSSTRSRAIPHLMTTRIGPMVGRADSEPVYLSARDLAHGCAAVGRPGSGKSVLLQNLFAWSMLDRTQPSGEEGFPGAAHSLIAFEPKLDGAEAYLDWARATGDVVRVVEVANPDGESIDLSDVPGTVADKAEFLTEALRYAFDDGAIQGASAEALRAVLGGGMVTTDDMVTALHRGPQGSDPIPQVELGRSFIYYAHVLLGGLGDVPAVALAKQINLAATADRAEGLTASNAIAADARLTPIFERTPSFRSAYCQAPRNKLDALMSVEHFFAPHRPKHTWTDVLTNHRALVVLTGVDAAGHMMSTTAEKLMSSLLMYSLRDAIERTCTGWEAAARWVSVFVDELSMIAGNDPEIVTWLKNRGRSYGVRPIFATQYPTQLHPQVREAFLSFAILLSYTLDNPTIAAEVVADLSGDGTEWTVTDVLELAPYHALIRANVHRQRQPGFPFRAEYWAASPADRARFVTDQGYAPITPAAPSGLGIAS